MEKGSNIEGDESGGTSPSRQGAGTGILSPRNLFSMAAEIGIASGEKRSCLGVSTPRGLYRRRGASRGHQGQPGGCPARPTLGAAPGTLLAPWQWPRPSPLVILESSEALIFNIIFAEFFGHFNQPENLKNKNSRKPGTGNWVH